MGIEGMGIEGIEKVPPGELGSTEASSISRGVTRETPYPEGSSPLSRGAHRHTESTKGEFYFKSTKGLTLDEGELHFKHASVEPDHPEPAEQGDHLVTLDVAEDVREALGETLAEPVTDVVVKGIGVLEGGGGDAAAQAAMDEICRDAIIGLDPKGFVSSSVDKAVRHMVTPALTASLGPLGVVIGVFAGKLAGAVTKQALDADGDAGGVHGVERVIEVADVVADASLGRLAESEQFKEYVNNLLSKPIIAIIPSNTPAAPGERPAHMASQAPDHLVGQPATIRGVLVVCKVGGPTRGPSADQPELLRLQQRLHEVQADADCASEEASFETASRLKHEEIPDLERKLADARGAVLLPGDSSVLRLQPLYFTFACVPEDAVAERRTLTRCQPDKLEQESLLLMDGTLIERHIDRGVPGSWTSVSGGVVWPDQG